MKKSRPDTALARAAPAPLARPDVSSRPSPVSVYLQAKPGMGPNLRVVLRLLGADAKGYDVTSFPWEGLRFENVSVVRTLLVEHLAPAYARKCLVAVRGVLKTARRMRVLSYEEYASAVDVDPIKGDSAQAGRMLGVSEIHAMLQASECGDFPARDAAIIALAAYCGLRREEVSSLDRESYIAENRGHRIEVIGKGSKRRSVFVPDAARVVIARWLAYRTAIAPGPLFWRGRKGGKLVPGRRLSPSGVWEVITRAAAAAKVENVTPHDFRRTFASTLFDEGVDPVTVQKLMGHEDPKTTARYDRRGDEKKIAAADALARAYGKEK